MNREKESQPVAETYFVKYGATDPDPTVCRFKEKSASTIGLLEYNK